MVAPREGRVSRNDCPPHLPVGHPVAPREGRVSRNPRVQEDGLCV